MLKKKQTYITLQKIILHDQLADFIKISEAEDEMVVNLDNFQTIILNRKEMQATHKLIIDNKEIKTTNSIKLKGMNTDDQLKFNEHISILCSKAAI